MDLQTTRRGFLAQSAAILGGSSLALTAETPKVEAAAPEPPAKKPDTGWNFQLLYDPFVEAWQFLVDFNGKPWSNCWDYTVGAFILPRCDPDFLYRPNSFSNRIFFMKSVEEYHKHDPLDLWKISDSHTTAWHMRFLASMLRTMRFRSLGYTSFPSRVDYTPGSAWGKAIPAAWTGTNQFGAAWDSDYLRFLLCTDHSTIIQPALANRVYCEASASACYISSYKEFSPPGSQFAPADSKCPPRSQVTCRESQ